MILTPAELRIVATFFPPPRLSFWASQEGLSLLQCNLDSLARLLVSANAYAVVFTSAPKLAQHVLPRGFVVKTLYQPESVSTGAELPSGELLLAMRTWSDPATGKILYVDLLHAFDLESNPFEKALRLVREGARLVLGVNQCRDHPCQFVKAENIAALGQLRMFESPDEARRGLLTKPFPLEWSAFSSAMTYRGATHRMHPETGDLLPTEDDSDGAEVSWIWEDSCHARLFFSQEALQAVSECWGLADARSLAGWSLESVGDHVLVVAEKNNGNQIRVRALNPTKGARLHLTDLCNESNEHIGPADGLNLDAPNHGFRFGLLEPGRNGRGSHVRVFEPQGSLWRYRGIDGTMVCTTTGRAIRGRQDFVTVHTVRPELMAFGAELLTQWPPKLSEGGWMGLPEGVGLRIDTEVQALRHRIRQAVRSGEGHGSES